MNQLQVFNFEKSKVRIVKIEGQPWFVAADACRCLGFNMDVSNAGHHLRKLHADEVRGNRVPGMRGSQAKCISESGLYKLIMRSDKPEAKRFQDWVTREVLPAIRQNGGYIAGQEKLKTGEMSESEFIAKALVMATKTLESYRPLVEQVSIAGWSAIHYRNYLAHDQKLELAFAACRIARKQGFKLTKEPRTFHNLYGQEIPTKVNIYPVEVLNQAAKEIGLN